MVNAATGTGPTIKASGDNTNIDLNIYAKGSGSLILGNTAGAGIIQLGGDGATQGCAVHFSNDPDFNYLDCTSSTIMTAGIELGNATDTTLSRNSAGVLAVEGVAIPTASSTTTFTNKTLTAPKIGTSILDTNGNELLILTATASAVNEITLANGATGASPKLTASGETNVGLDFQVKGHRRIPPALDRFRPDGPAGSSRTPTTAATTLPSSRRPRSGSDVVFTLPSVTGTFATLAGARDPLQQDPDRAEVRVPAASWPMPTAMKN